MSTETLGTAFGELRHRQGKSMQDIADACGVDQSTVSNIERDRPCRWETVHTVLTGGMWVEPDGATYKRFHALWLARRAEIAESQPDGHAQKGLSRHATEVVRKFRNLVRDLSPEDAKACWRAAERAGRKLSE
jgi:hypothetical protein